MGLIPTWGRKYLFKFIFLFLHSGVEASVVEFPYWTRDASRIWFVWVPSAYPAVCGIQREADLFIYFTYIHSYIPTYILYQHLLSYYWQVIKQQVLSMMNLFLWNMSLYKVLWGCWITDLLEILFLIKFLFLLYFLGISVTKNLVLVLIFFVIYMQKTNRNQYVEIMYIISNINLISV